MRNGNSDANAMTELAGQLSTVTVTVSTLYWVTLLLSMCIVYCVVHVVHGEWGALTRSN